MNITVNGEERTTPEGATIRSLLEGLGLGETLVAVERNTEIVPRADHSTCVIKDGDAIEIVHFVGGG